MPKSIALEFALQAALALVVGLGVSVVLAGATLFLASRAAPPPGTAAAIAQDAAQQ